MQMLLTGELVDATEAHRIGLVNRVVPAEQLIPVATAMLQTILSNSALAVAGCIEAVNAGYDIPLGNALAFETAMAALVSAAIDPGQPRNASNHPRT